MHPLQIVLFTEMFINQASANTFGGFLPNTTSPDPNWGKCLRCAAIDRARLKLTPPPSRSDFCSQCFSSYCYGPSYAPSVQELPDRNYVFLNPDPGGVTKVKKFLSSNEGSIIRCGCCGMCDCRCYRFHVSAVSDFFSKCEPEFALLLT